MENASDAIIMAGAMLIFVIALTVSMTVFSQVRSASDDIIFSTDPANYYEYLDTEGTNVKNRIVGLETIIPTLYKYYKENYTVVFLDRTGKALPIYTTQTDPRLWSGNITEDLNSIPPLASKYPGIAEERTNPKKIEICSFDVDEETKRHEPWTGSTIDYKKNMDAFLKGGKFDYPSGSGDYYQYSNFIDKYSNKKFRETIGEYAMNRKDTFASELDKGIRNNKNKRVIIYQLVTEE